MPNSNVKKLRKKYAGLIEAELYTINHELEESFTKLKELDAKRLKVLDLERLKRLRCSIQGLKSRIISVNADLNSVLTNKSYFGQVGIFSEDGKQTIIVKEHSLRLAQITDDTYNRIPTAKEVVDEIKMIEQ